MSEQPPDAPVMRAEMVEKFLFLHELILASNARADAYGLVLDTLIAYLDTRGLISRATLADVIEHDVLKDPFRDDENEPFVRQFVNALRDLPTHDQE